jgi:hypothetical protein
LIIQGSPEYFRNPKGNTVVAGENSGDPYRCEMISEFNQFTVHSPMIFLPLVIKD